MTFEERTNKFQGELDVVQKKYNVQLYAAQVLLQSGEFAILIKLRDLLPQETVIDTNKKYEDKSKKRYSASEKA